MVLHSTLKAAIGCVILCFLQTNGTRDNSIVIAINTVITSPWLRTVQVFTYPALEIWIRCFFGLGITIRTCDLLKVIDVRPTHLPVVIVALATSINTVRYGRKRKIAIRAGNWL